MNNPTLNHAVFAVAERSPTKIKELQLRHVYSSLIITSHTLQLQRRRHEALTPVIHRTHRNHLHSRQILDFTDRILPEGIRSNDHLLQFLAILQIELARRMEFRPLRLLREALLSNHHNLQFVQSNYLHFLHRLERIAVDSDFFDVGKPAQIQLQQAMASIVGEMELRNGGGQSGQLVSIVDLHERG